MAKAAGGEAKRLDERLVAKRLVAKPVAKRLVAKPMAKRAGGDARLAAKRWWRSGWW
ncbi:MAG: hypothetical protein H6703_15150 [Myxococcales bacterium]|nr:hypothetical protein [Myxococcales bacterium]